jgi:hypothetical protein
MALRVLGLLITLVLLAWAATALAAADAAGYCLEPTWVRGKLYHLRGPGGRPAEGHC